jgi:endonuclease YncB( thermonuclease family)
LVQLLNQEDVSIERHGKDRYDRTLAVVRVAGVDVGDILVQEGLARYWPDGSEFWCN